MSLPKQTAARQYASSFSLGWIFWIVTVAGAFCAVLVRSPQNAICWAPVLPIAVLGLPDRRTLIRYTAVLVAFYAPALFGFLLPCHHCRRFWLQHFAIVPSMVPIAWTVVGLNMVGATVWLAALLCTTYVGLNVVATFWGQRGFALIVFMLAICSALTSLELSSILMA